MPASFFGSGAMGIDVDQITADVAFEQFAETVVFNGREVQGIPSRELVTLDGYDGMVEERTTLEIKLADVGQIRGDMPVQIRGKSYKVDRPMTDGSEFGVASKVLLRWA